MSARSFVWSIGFGLGLLLLFVGERLIGTGTARWVVSSFGALLVLVALAVRALRMARADGERRRVERLLFVFTLVGVVALLLYALQGDVWAQLSGVALEKPMPKLATALGALWVALVAVAVLPLLLSEMSYASMQRAPKVEANRVRDAALSGVGLACVAVFAFSGYYVARERDAKADFSYFRTTRPGEATRNLVRALEDKVEVSAFFPPSNEVREYVAEYLTDLAKESPKLEVSFYDQALDPKRARELGVTGNGTVVVKKGERKELIGFGLELERARGQLRSLDQDFQKRLLQVARAKRTVYFTTGHGERAADKMNSTDQRWTLRLLRELYGDLNYDVRNVGMGEGLGQQVPQDAAALVIAGPAQAFMPEELESISRYLDGGGRVLLALDPEAKLDFHEVLSKYGVAYHPVTLANDISYLARTRQPSDRQNLTAVGFSSHPSVTTLGRLGQRAPVVFVGTGFIDEQGKKPEAVRVDFTVHSHPMTWADENGDFQNDAAKEPRRVFELAAAISQTHEGGPETRLVVLADSEVLTDPVIENAGNAYLALDGIKWLLGEESLAGEVNSEEDVPIQHTRKQDVAWFYSTIFAAPVLVLAVGYAATRRRGRARKKDQAREAVR